MSKDCKSFAFEYQCPLSMQLPGRLHFLCQELKLLRSLYHAELRLPVQRVFISYFTGESGLRQGLPIQPRLITNSNYIAQVDLGLEILLPSPPKLKGTILHTHIQKSISYSVASSYSPSLNSDVLRAFSEDTAHPENINMCHRLAKGSSQRAVSVA